MIDLIFCCFPFSCSRGNKYRSLLNKEGKLISNLALKIDGMKGKDALARERYDFVLIVKRNSRSFSVGNRGFSVRFNMNFGLWFVLEN